VASTPERWIIHADLDAFFAAVETLDDPSLRGRPVIVGGLGRRGVVATANYEARRFGVHSAMPTTQARRLCPEGAFLSPRFERYRELSRGFREICHSFTPVVEPVSLDEAYLDVSGSIALFGAAEGIAARLRERVRAELGLVVSAGVAKTRFVAKLASGRAKPDGLLVLDRDRAATLLPGLEVGEIRGFGSVTAERLRALGLTTVAHLLALGDREFTRLFGSRADAVRALLRGEDTDPVGLDPSRSISHEETYATDLTSGEEKARQVRALAAAVGRRLREHGFLAKTVTLKVRDSSFKTVTRRRTLPRPTDLDRDLAGAALALLLDLPAGRPLRLLGVGASGLCDGLFQASLFAADERSRSLDRIKDDLRNRFGAAALQPAESLATESSGRRPETGSARPGSGEGRG
jgi:DNA polymerase-4